MASFIINIDAEVAQDITLYKDSNSLVTTDETSGNIRTYSETEDLVLDKTLTGNDEVTATLSYQLTGGGNTSIIRIYAVLNDNESTVLINKQLGLGVTTGEYVIKYIPGRKWSIKKIIAYDTTLLEFDEVKFSCFNDSLTDPQVLVINSGNYTNPTSNVSSVMSFT